MTGPRSRSGRGANPGRGHWLLARRSITDPDEIAYYLCYGPADTELTEFVRVAGSQMGHRRMLTKPPKMKPDSTTTKSVDTKHGIGSITLSMAAAAFLVTHETA